MVWQKNAPISDGWYFWRKTSRQNDPWRWHAYFILMEGGEQTFWENGVEVIPPTGGLWSDHLSEDRA